MRKISKSDGLAVQAISGTHVVMLGMNLTKGKAKGVLGFAIERMDHTEKEKYWLRGFKTFPMREQDLVPGSSVPTLEAPIQSFLWGDYTAKPDHDYTYRVVAMRGAPKLLKQGEEVAVRIQTESPDQGTHAVWFNRGVAGSQAYARRFGNRHPDEVPNREAWEWAVILPRRYRHQPEIRSRAASSRSFTHETG